MDESVRLNIKKFDQELESYRLFTIEHKELLRKNPLLDKQITFWMESTRFLVAELEIWNEFGNETKCSVTIARTQKSLDRLSRLVEGLKNQNGL